jgi:23S rRNA (cytidine1920-2'-O)/16S rRNA (cytidine1409-2'-O)-methyltransferase
MKNKERADKLVFDKGLSRSREEAKRLIMAGLVYLENRQIQKAGELISKEAEIFVKGKIHPFVGRGGIKLEHAVNTFNIDISNRVCADIGSSTGGFTDCLLMHGAKKVFAIDSGTNQLVYKLRTDKRVIVMENTNARHLTLKQIEEPVSFICMDVSFISVTKIIPVFKEISENEKTDCVILVKPQFEVGKDEVEKKGIIKDKNKHLRVIKQTIDCAKSYGFYYYNLTKSPIQGQKGNIEYLLHLRNKKQSANINNMEQQIKQVVFNDKV